MAPPTMKWYISSKAHLQKNSTHFRKSRNCSLSGESHSLVFCNNLWSLAKLLSFVLGKLIKVKICKLSQWYAACVLVLSFCCSKHFQNLVLLTTVPVQISIFVWLWDPILNFMVAKVAKMLTFCLLQDLYAFQMHVCLYELWQGSLFEFYYYVEKCFLMKTEVLFSSEACLFDKAACLCKCKACKWFPL